MFAAVALIGVEGIVVVEGTDEVAGVDGSAEEFKSVILDGVGFDVFDGGAATDGTEGESVDFLVGFEDFAAVPDGDVAEAAGAVVIILTTKDEVLVVGIGGWMPS